jgi:PAS domain S-box-containing protein
MLSKSRAMKRFLNTDAFFRVVAENTTDAIWTMDLHGDFTFVNPAVERLLGYSPEELAQLNAADVLPAESLQRADEALQQLTEAELPVDIHQQEPAVVELQHRHKNGQLIWCEVSLRALLDEARKPVGYIGVTRDIEQRKLAEIKLIHYQRRLRDMASRLSLVAERERRAIAADLHDGIGQNLTALKIKLSALRQNHTTDTDGPQLSDAIRLVDQTIRDTRSLTFELSPPILYEFGVAAAFEWYLEQLQERFGIKTSFTRDCPMVKLTEEYRMLLFRVVRELLFNVVKHAKASRVDVLFRGRDDRLIIEIKDNGIGFDAEDLTDSGGGTPGFGLFSVRERVEYLDGTMTMDSTPGAGARFVIDVPLSPGLDNE